LIKIESQQTEPLCPVFGECGGCLYQNITYSEELKIKENSLRSLFQLELKSTHHLIEPIVASPKPYYYRNRLDLRLLRTKSKDVFIGFSSLKNRIIPIESCPIAEDAINRFIPELKKQATAKLPQEKYRNANLVIRTGEDGRVFWGGIGKGSLQMKEEDFLFTTINNQPIYYSLETFFQANLSILPLLIEKITALDIWNQDTTFFDLYGGVGFFGIAVSKHVKKVYTIEECPGSIRLARYNQSKNNLPNFEIIAGRVEKHLPDLLSAAGGGLVAMVDPPRGGLSEESAKMLSAIKQFQHFLYLSCSPETLTRDLKIFLAAGWKIQRVIPFDFFPRTKHLETLVLLAPV
jgi:23S rRNA (uracil1939-C5)-methyltransferase/tRNA (uracil-5-)-methyltransferase